MQEQVLEEINKIIEFLKEEDKVKLLYPESLSRAEIRLAVLLANLGEMTALANKEWNDAETRRKFGYANTFNLLKKIYIEKGIKPTVSDLDNEVEESIKEKRFEENERRYQFERLRNLADALVTIINALKDRIKVMAKEEIVTPTIESGGGN